jgi:hypothetical protein
VKHAALLIAVASMLGCGGLHTDLGGHEGVQRSELNGQPTDPTPLTCEGLGYDACRARPDCDVRLEPCPLPPCTGPSCPVCSPSFACVPRPQSPCTGLGERACNKRPGCLAIYVPLPTPPGQPCPNCERFDFCKPDLFCGGSGNTPHPGDAGMPSFDAGSAPPSLGG